MVREQGKNAEENKVKIVKKRPVSTLAAIEKNEEV